MMNLSKLIFLKGFLVLSFCCGLSFAFQGEKFQFDLPGYCDELDRNEVEKRVFLGIARCTIDSKQVFIRLSQSNELESDAAFSLLVSNVFYKGYTDEDKQLLIESLKGFYGKESRIEVLNTGSILEKQKYYAVSKIFTGKKSVINKTVTWPVKNHFLTVNFQFVGDLTEFPIQELESIEDSMIIHDFAKVRVFKLDELKDYLLGKKIGSLIGPVLFALLALFVAIKMAKVLQKGLGSPEDLSKKE